MCNVKNRAAHTVKKRMSHFSIHFSIRKEQQAKKNICSLLSFYGTEEAQDQILKLLPSFKHRRNIVPIDTTNSVNFFCIQIFSICSSVATSSDVLIQTNIFGKMSILILCILRLFLTHEP